MSNELVVVFKGDAGHLKSEVGGVRSALGGLGDIAGGALKVGLLGAAAGGVALAAGLGSAVKAAMDAEVGQAALGAVLQSTGGKAGVTKDMANELASALQNVTRFEDDTILATESLLLTFTSISKDIFPQTTEMALNLATAMGGDTKGAAIQLGKALNDPTKGMAALSRVGVSFTKAQKEQIEALQESGDLLGAQKIILAELETEFGGAARAAGETFAGKLDILNNKFGDIMESIGGALIPILTEVADALIGVINNPAIQQGLKLFGDMFEEFIAGIKAGENPLQSLIRVLGMFKVTSEIGSSLSGLSNIVAAFVSGVQTGIPIIQSVLAAVWAFIAPILSAIFAELAKFWEEVAPKLQAAWESILAGTQAVLAVIAAVIIENWDTIAAYLSGIWLIIQGIVEVAWALIEGIIKIALDLIAGDFEAAGQDFTTMMQSIWSGILKIIEGAWNAITAVIKLALDTLGKLILEKLIEVRDWFIEKFGEIMDFMSSLPGRFAALGAQMIASLVEGLYSRAGDVIEALGDIIQAAIDALWNALLGSGGSTLPPPPPPTDGGSSTGFDGNGGNGGAQFGGSSNRGGSGTVNVYANVRNSQDIDALADAISQRLGTRAQHRISRGI